MLENMASFFDTRLDGYDAHMLDTIEGARDFYPFTASQLPAFPAAEILDLGCGTGLELDEYFACNPSARVTGIDLAPGMLDALAKKFPGKSLCLTQGSYFDIPLGADAFDAAVSVESLHHFTAAEKLPLYRNLFSALRPGGWFVLTDYFAATQEQQDFFRTELMRLKALEGVDDGALYHYDTPLTVDNEIRVLTKAGFSRVDILKHWGATYTLKAMKEGANLCSEPE